MSRRRSGRGGSLSLQASFQEETDDEAGTVPIVHRGDSTMAIHRTLRGRLRSTGQPPEADVIRSFTLDYWLDDGWYVGKLREVPGVFSQGESLEALKINIRDAYGLVMQEAVSVPVERFDSTELELEVS